MFIDAMYVAIHDAISVGIHDAVYVDIPDAIYVGIPDAINVGIPDAIYVGIHKSTLRDGESDCWICRMEKIKEQKSEAKHGNKPKPITAVLNLKRDWVFSILSCPVS